MTRWAATGQLGQDLVVELVLVDSRRCDRVGL